MLVEVGPWQTQALPDQGLPCLPHSPRVPWLPDPATPFPLTRDPCVPPAAPNQVLNSMDLFGLSHQPLRFSPNATLRWERCVVRRRVGWSPEASLLNLLAAPR